MNHFSRAFCATILLLLAFNAWSKVDPPNYDFSLDRLEPFAPGSDLDKALKPFGEVRPIKSEKGFEVRKVYIEHIRYKFPLLIQSKGNVITDFYARLPAYFLHNIFHQSLINRMGKQDIYKKVEEQAVYAWKKDQVTHVYSGACSITCFPVYYSAFSTQAALDRFKPLIEQLSSQEVSFK